MAETLKNLCAPIPESLHNKLREKQTESGKTLSEYMTWLITEFYENEGRTIMKDNQRTVAFQVKADLFNRFKEFLKEKGIKQNAFFLECIEKAMSAWEHPETADAEPETEDTEAGK